MASIQARVSSLLAELKKVAPSVSPDSVVDQNSLKQVLDQKSGAGGFDPDIYEQLFERLQEKQEQGQINNISWKNFATVYVEAEDLLKQKQLNSKKILEDCYVKRSEVSQKLQEVRQTEVLNQHGIALNSNLTVGVKSVSLTSRQAVSPYVHVSLGQNQTFQTTNGVGQNATFNNTFHLQHIEQGFLFFQWIEYCDFIKRWNIAICYFQKNYEKEISNLNKSFI